MFVYPLQKISQVMMKWRCQTSHLGRFTLWHKGRRATQLGKFTLWNNGRRAKQPALMHAPSHTFSKLKKVTNHAAKYEGLIQGEF